MQDNKKRVFFKNTVMLYILTFSGYVFNFITVPYQTRILGPEAYGLLGFAQSCAVYIQLLLDFGFILSATGEVARHKDDPAKLSRIMSAVLACKLILGVLSLSVVIILCLTVTKFQQDVTLYIAYFVATFINALLPDFLYRGVEKMSSITYRTVSVKLFFTVAIFLLLKNRSQYYIIPILNGLGALGACIWTYWDVYHRIGARFVWVKWSYVWATLKHSSGYFWSRIASTVHGATNSVILGILYPVGNTLGYYTSAEKLMATARSALTPISDSLYPYMVKNRDYKLVKKILCYLMPLIILGCTVVWIFCEPFCVLLFGEEFRGSAPLLRLLLPVIVISLPTYIFGFPVLSPMGLERYANTSVIIGAVEHACVLGVLYLTGNLTATTICIATCITELLILLIRLLVVVKHRGKMRKS